VIALRQPVKGLTTEICMNQINNCMYVFRQADIARWLDKRADGGRTSRRVQIDVK
jgi:hypothetical protein